MEEKLVSISEYLDVVKAGLARFRGRVVGEVGKVDSGPNGHVYFSLRDEQDKSVMSCIIWAGKYRVFGVKLEEGLKIIASGSPDIYKPTGRFSFLADSIELAGEGLLKKEYERLRGKFEKEGLFDPANKRKLPRYPQRIGIITSKQGAVLGDFLSNIGTYGFKISLIDSRVEGQLAVEDLLAALAAFRKTDIEVLVLMRGGGSFESLQAFNNELLVREVAGFPVPVIAAIGHDRDVPLVSLAADVMVSTPTAATMKLNQSWDEIILFLERQERKITETYAGRLEAVKRDLTQGIAAVEQYSDAMLRVYRDIEQEVKVAIQNFAHMLGNTRDALAVSLRAILASFGHALRAAAASLENAESLVAVHNPERQLRLGYSIAKKRGAIITRVNQVQPGDDLEVVVRDGSISSKVASVTTSQ